MRNDGFRQLPELDTGGGLQPGRAVSARLESVLYDSQPSDFCLQGRARDAELGSRTRRTCNPAPALGQSGFDKLSFLFSSQPSQPMNFLIRSRRFRLQPGFVHPKDLVIAEDYSSLDHVLQFANIARPILGLKQFQRPLLNTLDFLAGFARVSFGEVFHK